MTGSCSLWLMLVARLVAFLPLICVAPVHCQHAIIVKENYRITILLAIKNNESGLQLEYLFQENCGSIDDSVASQWPNLQLGHQMHFIPGLQLSSECGDQYFRCQQLLVKILSPQEHGGEFTIVFVPLETSLLLLSYWYDNYRPVMIKWSTFIMSSSNCSPTVVYNISSKIYMVCVSSHQYIAVYEVLLNLNVSVIEGAALIGPLSYVTISNSSNFSNFITVGHRIFFAIGNTVVVMDIFDTAQAQQYPELPECTQIHKLVPTIGAGNQQMLVAYCSDRYIYLDPVYGDWTNIQLFSSSGVPYLCPDNNYRATLFINGTLQFTVKDLLLNTINGISIIKSNGVCFESQNKTYFAYSDQQHNDIFVYDFTTQNHYPILSPYDCSHQDCPQLLLLDNQYLVVRDDNCDIVLDVTTNFSLLINISGGIADILTILRINVICHDTITSGPAPPITQNNTTITTVSPDIPEPTTSVVVHSNSRLVGITLTVLGLFIIILLLAMIAVGFFIRYLRRRWRNNMHRAPRIRYVTNQSPSIPLLANDSAQEEEEEEEEEDESHEMESMASHSRESHFSKGWRWTTTL